MGCTMQNNLVIRNGRLKDAEKSLPVWNQFMDYHKRISTMDSEMTDNAGEIWVKYFQRHVRSRRRKAIVAEQDGEIAGFLLGEIQKRPPIFTNSYQGFIDSIGVLESKRNQGIGALMLDAFAEWAREKELPYVLLNVVVENEIAKRLYERQGFKTILLAQRKIL
jgi:ribosomal protein S18 acetylase RimI-like enzyme